MIVLIFIKILIEHSDQTLHSAASDLDLCYLSMSHRRRLGSYGLRTTEPLPLNGQLPKPLGKCVCV